VTILLPGLMFSYAVSWTDWSRSILERNSSLSSPGGAGCVHIRCPIDPNIATSNEVTEALVNMIASVVARRRTVAIDRQKNGRRKASMR
jgi:hypothetical protein